MEIWTSAKADQEFSRFIRARDTRCFFCPNPTTQCSHFWGRGNSATRYDPDNCDGICGGCHMRHEGNKQGLYREKKLAQLGESRYKVLEIRARSILKRSDAIIQCMILLEHNPWQNPPSNKSKNSTHSARRSFPKLKRMRLHGQKKRSASSTRSAFITTSEKRRKTSGAR
jgi:hypothetical protein